MKIANPQFLNEIGGRQNNEDAIYPPAATARVDDRLFLVCDGVGGHEKGEIASSLLAKYFSEFVKRRRNSIPMDQLFSKALAYAEKGMSGYIQRHPKNQDMATTLTALLLQDDGNHAIVGWVGDSRVYHVREGRVLYRTKDHTRLQWLLDTGQITEEQTRNHPQAHIIERAVNGIQPAKIDQQLLTDLQPNDYLLLCSDGLLEHLGEAEIKRWFLADREVASLRDQILQNARERTRDNFSMYLIKVESTGVALQPKREKVAEAAEDNFAELLASASRETSDRQLRRQRAWIAPAILLLVLFAMILSYLWPFQSDSEASEHLLDSADVTAPQLEDIEGTNGKLRDSVEID